MSVRFAYDPSRQPPAPVLVVTLSSPGGVRSLAGIEALLDTGASHTVLPLTLASQLGLTAVSQATAQGFGGQRYLLDLYRVVLDLPGLGSFVLDLPAHSGEAYILIGRDVLNVFRITFDGPNQTVEFH